MVFLFFPFFSGVFVHPIFVHFNLSFMANCAFCGQQLDELDYNFQNCLNCSRPVSIVEPEDYEEEVYFEPCNDCDLPDACEDFDCAAAPGYPIDYPI